MCGLASVVSGKECLEYAENSSLIRIERCKVAVLWHTPVSAGIDPSEARKCLMRADVVEMVVEQGLPERFSLGKPSIFGL